MSYIESNMEIYRNGKPETITITIKKYSCPFISAFSNNGKEVFLSEKETIEAFNILVEEDDKNGKSKRKKNHSS